MIVTLVRIDIKSNGCLEQISGYAPNFLINPNLYDHTF